MIFAGSASSPPPGLTAGMLKIAMVALDTLADVLLSKITAAFPDRHVLGDFEALVRELVAAS